MRIRRISSIIKESLGNPRLFFFAKFTTSFMKGCGFMKRCNQHGRDIVRMTPELSNEIKTLLPDHSKALMALHDEGACLGFNLGFGRGVIAGTCIGLLTVGVVITIDKGVKYCRRKRKQKEES